MVNQPPKDIPPVQNTPSTGKNTPPAQDSQFIDKYVLMGNTENGKKSFYDIRNAKIADAAYLSQTNNISLSSPTNVVDYDYSVVGIFTNKETIELIKMLRENNDPKIASPSAPSQEVAVVAPKLPLIPGLGGKGSGGPGGSFT